MKRTFTWERIEKWRDRVHRRTPALAVSNMAEALSFINSVGFCFAFKSEHSELPCLWHAACGRRDPVVPKHTHIDPSISFVWEMKDRLPAQRKIYYGKLLKSRPTMVSLEYLPYFYVLAERTGARDEYVQEHRRGKLSPVARSVMEALLDSWPQTTKGLKLATGMHGKSDRAMFDRAIAELQGKMFIVKIAEEYEPFSFVWAPFVRSFPAQVRKARRIGVEEARVRLLERYFANQLVGTVTTIQRLFRWSKQEIYHALGQLMHRGSIRTDIIVEGKDHRYYGYVEQR
jgi:hypothetical protein